MFEVVNMFVSCFDGLLLLEVDLLMVGVGKVVLIVMVNFD